MMVVRSLSLFFSTIPPLCYLKILFMTNQVIHKEILLYFIILNFNIKYIIFSKSYSFFEWRIYERWCTNKK